MRRGVERLYVGCEGMRGGTGKGYKMAIGSRDVVIERQGVYPSLLADFTLSQKEGSIDDSIAHGRYLVGQSVGCG